jgi:signal transduction histidine kinase
VCGSDCRKAAFSTSQTGGCAHRTESPTGSVPAVSVLPAYYQTAWFAALSTGTLIALVWGAHRVRLRIVEKHQRELTALNERMMKAQEQERIRIAGELHDGVLQSMLAVTMMLGTAKRGIMDDSNAKAMIDKAQQKLIQAGTDIRQLSHDLHPPARVAIPFR